MIYCVVPKPLADELYPKLVKHYENDENVTVIIDRREADRRARGSQPSEAELQRRVVRDREAVITRAHHHNRCRFRAIIRVTADPGVQASTGFNEVLSMRRRKHKAFAFCQLIEMHSAIDITHVRAALR